MSRCGLLDRRQYSWAAGGFRVQSRQISVHLVVVRKLQVPPCPRIAEQDIPETSGPSASAGVYHPREKSRVPTRWTGRSNRRPVRLLERPVQRVGTRDFSRG